MVDYGTRIMHCHACITQKVVCPVSLRVSLSCGIPLASHHPTSLPSSIFTSSSMKILTLSSTTPARTAVGKHSGSAALISLNQHRPLLLDRRC